MDIKAHMAEIANRLGPEETEKVNLLLKEIEREVLDVQDALKAANSEAKDRRLKLGEAKTQLEEKDAELEKLKNDTTVKELQAEIQELKGFKTQVHSQNRKDFEKRYEQIQEHPNWEKVKGQLKIPAEEDGKIDLTKIADEDVGFNLAKLKEYDNLGLFEASKTSTTHLIPAIENIDMTKVGDLAEKNPEAYKKIRDQHLSKLKTIP